jgi:cephalosporin hydroxylase
VTTAYKSVKWNHYDALYAAHLPPDPKRLLEIGVAHGGSLVKWKNRFPDCDVHGLDFDARCARPPGCTVHIGSQTDAKFLRTFAGRSDPAFDVIIDDGGHRPYQILATFRELFPRLSMNGVYVIEDLQVSEKFRWRMWQAIFGGPRSLVAGLMAEQNRFVRDADLSWKSPGCIALYPHILFIHKRGLIVTEQIEQIEPAQKEK